jgi:hypothetical protein
MVQRSLHRRRHARASGRCATATEGSTHGRVGSAEQCLGARPAWSVDSVDPCPAPITPTAYR